MRTSVHAIAPIVRRLLSLVLIDLDTSALSRGESGIVAPAASLLLSLPFLVGIGPVAGLSHFYFEHDGPRDRSWAISGTSIVPLSLVAAGAALCFLPRGPIAALLLRGRDDVDASGFAGSTGT